MSVTPDRLWFPPDWWREVGIQTMILAASFWQEYDE